MEEDKKFVDKGNEPGQIWLLTLIIMTPRAHQFSAL